MNDELKPCFACGAIPSVVHHPDKFGNNYRVTCNHFHDDGGENLHDVTVWHRTAEGAVELWNRRPAPTWSKEPPTEEGLFWLDVGYDVIPVRIFGDNTKKDLTVFAYAPGFYICDMLENFIVDRKCLRWLKIEVPALPEEREGK